MRYNRLPSRPTARGSQQARPAGQLSGGQSAQPARTCQTITIHVATVPTIAPIQEAVPYDCTGGGRGPGSVATAGGGSTPQQRRTLNSCTAEQPRAQQDLQRLTMWCRSHRSVLSLIVNTVMNQATMNATSGCGGQWGSEMQQSRTVEETGQRPRAVREAEGACKHAMRSRLMAATAGRQCAARRSSVPTRVPSNCTCSINDSARATIMLTRT